MNARLNEKKDKKRKNGRAPQTFPLYDLSNEGSY